MEPTQIGDELYALPPNAFTAARDERVAEARAAGDRTLAAAIAALKRPTVGAWLVNVVALRRPEVLAEVFDVAAEIRAGQGPAQLRELGQRRRQAVDAVTATARALATAAGAGEPTRAQLDEVESTLTAAMADDRAAGFVRTGRVLKALTYGGFGGFGDLGGEFVTSGSTRASTSNRPAAKTAARRSDQAEPSPATADAQPAAAVRARAAAEEKVADANRLVATAAAAEAEARHAVERLTQDLDRLRQQLDDAERSARTARSARLAAERDLAAAQRRLNRLD